MNGYTIAAAKPGSWGLRLLVVVVCLFMVGCVDLAGELWMWRYQVKGGYVRPDTEVRRRGDAEMEKQISARKD